MWSTDNGVAINMFPRFSFSIETRTLHELFLHMSEEAVVSLPPFNPSVSWLHHSILLHGLESGPPKENLFLHGSQGTLKCLKPSLFPTLHELFPSLTPLPILTL